MRQSEKEGRGKADKKEKTGNLVGYFAAHGRNVCSEGSAILHWQIGSAGCAHSVHHALAGFCDSPWACGRGAAIVIPSLDDDSI